MADTNTFESINRAAYKWPTFKPLSAKPAQPPVTTKPKNFFVKGPVDAYCHCDGHLYDPLLNKYKKLAEKEKLLQDELQQLYAEMANVNSSILEHECDSFDEKMETTYQIDYTKRGAEPPAYIKLMVAVDSPAGIPKISDAKKDNGYRDPTRFRYRPFPRPNIDPCPPVAFLTAPDTVKSWFCDSVGNTEYQDVISRTGMSVMKNSQQYKEPLPSSRRRYGEQCV